MALELEPFFRDNRIVFGFNFSRKEWLEASIQSRLLRFHIEIRKITQYKIGAKIAILKAGVL